jgi:hypothetical protein
VEIKKRIFSKQTVRKVKEQLETFKIMSTNFVVKKNVSEEAIQFSHVNLGFSQKHGLKPQV